MTACTLAPTPPASITSTAAAPFGGRLLRTLGRYFGRSVLTRDAIDQAWIDSGLGRLSRATLEDIGAPPTLVERAQQRESWRLAAALDATRHL